ncbi:MAG: DUF945 domain-containing protein [Proteobacteria bacterium]|nr:DUF945 domain-containing protein [Pseudomonadota bacterium]
MNSIPLNILEEKYPSLIQTAAFQGASARYSQIPTIEIIMMMMEQQWFPVKVMESHVRKEDRSCAFQFYLGVFRIACTNGLIVGEQFKRISVKHQDIGKEAVINASFKIIDKASKTIETIKDMKEIPLTGPEQDIFAKTALSGMLQIPFNDLETKSPYTPDQLLRARRRDDHGKDDLWTVMNTVQENMIKGGLRGFNPKTKKRVKTRGVKAIDKDVKLNTLVWTLAEKMKELKTKPS